MASMLTRLAGILAWPLPRQVHRGIFVLYLVVVMIFLTQSVCACAADKADIILNCSDNILGQSNYCHEQDALDRVNRLALIYRQLSSSHERELAFLAAKAKMLLYVSLNNCRNQFRGASPIEPVNTCIGRQLVEHQKLTQGTVTKLALLDVLRHGEFLTLDLIARLPSQFMGVQADWAGSLHLQPVGQGRMAGTISTYHPKLSIPAIMVHPDPDERVLLTEAGCKHECFSWWSGHFERGAGRIVFYADSRREACQRHFGPQE